MGPLTDFLDGPRARSAFLLQVKMSPPWAIRVQDDAPLTVVAMLTGSAYFSQRGGNPLLLEPGGLLLIRDSAAYVLADRPDERPAYFIGVGQNCSGSNGRTLPATSARDCVPGGTTPGGLIRCWWARTGAAAK